MSRNLSNQMKLTRAKVAVAAGTSDQNSSIIDMANFEGVIFTVLFGTITSGAVTSVKLQHGADSGGSDMADIEGTSITVADTESNKAVRLDLYRPRYRYVRCVVDRGTQNAVLDGITADQYGARVQPTTDDSTTVTGREVHVSDASGTA